jgi:hypothetical protein
MKDSGRSKLLSSLSSVAIMMAVFIAFVAPFDPATAVEPDLVEIGQAFGFDEDQVAALRAGEIQGAELDAKSDNELALSMALLSSRDVDWHWKRILAATRSDPTVLQVGELTGDGKASLEGLTLPPEELDALAETEAGPDSNFSSDEIVRLRRAATDAGDQAARRETLQAEMRAILAARYEAYRSGGLGGIAPYDRGDGDESSAAPQLERAFSALVMTKRLVPEVYSAMANFPAPPSEGIENGFFWMAHEANGRVVVALIHVVAGRAGGRIATVERRFYVSHTLNSLQAVSVAIPIAEGTAVFYANRTGTDQVTGFGSSVAKGVGRKIMRGELERSVEAFLQSSDLTN